MNLATADLNLLLVLHTVIVTRSATLAASRLGVTQPAVSNALRRARSLFDDPLVVRRGSAFALTPKAETLAPQLKGILDDVARLLAQEEAGQPRLVTIACLDALSIGLVPSLLALMSHQMPNSRLRTMTPDHVRLLGLERSEVDLVVGAVREIQHGCEFEDLIDDPMVVIADAMRHGPRSKLSVELYASLPHAELGVFGEPEDRVDRALAPLGLSRRIEAVVPHIGALPFLVRGAERVATMPRSLARQFAAPLGLRLLRVPVDLRPVSIKMVWHRRRAHDAQHLLLRELVRQAARKMARGGARGRGHM